MTTIIQIKNLHYQWAKATKPILIIKELTINKGEHIFIKGASGSGKTTLLNLLTGILLPNRGELMILDQALPNLSSSARDQFRSDHMGVIFQQFNLLPYLNVLDNVTLPCHFSKRRKQLAGNSTSTAQRLLTALGLRAELFNKSITELSVGQQQRVAVARALIGHPELIIADEPTSALDSDTRNDFLNLLFQEAQQQNSTILFVSHDPAIASHFPRVIDLAELNQA